MADSIAEQYFDELKSGGWAALSQWVSAARAETLHLDFKQAIDDEKFAKALSGFANTEGGLLVVGVGTTNGAKGHPDTASKFAVIDVKAEHGRLERLAKSLTDPPLSSVRVESITNPSNSSSGVVLVLVPASDGGPHRAADHAGKEVGGRYYMRTATDTLPMPHSLLSALFGRRPTPRFNLGICDIEGTGRIFYVWVRNDGAGTASDVCVMTTIACLTKDIPDPEPVNELNVVATWKVRAVRNRLKGWHGALLPERCLYPEDADAFASTKHVRGGRHFKIEGIVYARDCKPDHIKGEIRIPEGHREIVWLNG